MAGNEIRLSSEMLVTARNTMRENASEVSAATAPLATDVSADTFGPFGLGVGLCFLQLGTILAQHGKALSALLENVATNVEQARQHFESYEEETSRLLKGLDAGERS